MFIYLITNTVNGKYYVGQTIKAVATRMRFHWAQARAARDKMRLHRAMRKYGPDAFEWDVLATADSVEQLDLQERLWIIALDARNPDVGYNLAAGGEGGIGATAWSQEQRDIHSCRMSGPANYFFGNPQGRFGTEAAIKWAAEHPEDKSAICKRAADISWDGTTTEERTARTANMRYARWAKGVTRTWNSGSKERLRASVTGARNPFFGKHHTPESIAKANATRAARREARKEAINGMA